ncbi:hypothetical protein EVAR_39025_1 [Eumeta japonica]|uniref:Uncharacterized protein n=1 Tax=Eumeta variegata TaxID=151549 RepID=A0A4C1WNK5_EUMVA|nr:hypothetical protein EVAR_39025_1 [Eumeta japonica]
MSTFVPTNAPDILGRSVLVRSALLLDTERYKMPLPGDMGCKLTDPPHSHSRARPASASRPRPARVHPGWLRPRHKYTHITCPHARLLHAPVAACPYVLARIRVPSPVVPLHSRSRGRPHRSRLPHVPCDTIPHAYFRRHRTHAHSGPATYMIRRHADSEHVVNRIDTIIFYTFPSRRSLPACTARETSSPDTRS